MGGDDSDYNLDCVCIVNLKKKFLNVHMFGFSRYHQLFKIDGPVNTPTSNV